MTEEAVPETKNTDPTGLRLFHVHTTNDKVYGVRANHYQVLDQTIEFTVRLDDGSYLRVAAFPLVGIDAVIDAEYKG